MSYSHVKLIVHILTCKKESVENAFYLFSPNQKVIFFEMSMNSRHAGHGNLEIDQHEEFATGINESRGIICVYIPDIRG